MDSLLKTLKELKKEGNDKEYEKLSYDTNQTFTEIYKKISENLKEDDIDIKKFSLVKNDMIILRNYNEVLGDYIKGKFYLKILLL